MTTSLQPPGCIRYFPGWQSAEQGEGTFDALARAIAWEQQEITLFGRTVPTPRLTAWLAEAPYRYSGVTNEPQPWPAAVRGICDRLTAQLGVPFNSCLANLYRDGSDAMGYHSDDEPELGPEPTIASVSLGARRSFALRHRSTGQRWTWLLGEGDLLVMAGESQREYAHAVPRTRRPVGPRMNLTFRQFSPV